MTSRPERQGRADKASRRARQVVNALGAPLRFVVRRGPFRSAWGARDDLGGGDWRRPTAGDREPRRPRPGPPVDAIALPEPRD